MPYSFPNNVPQWAKNKSDAVQKVSINVFNETFKQTKDENKARQAALAAMINAEKEFKSRAAGKSKVTKSVMDILADKYNKQG